MNVESFKINSGRAIPYPVAALLSARSIRPLLLPLGLWVLAWLSINTGPWTFDEFGNGLAGSANAIRAAFPLVVFVVGGLLMLSAVNRQRSWAEIGFWLYALIALMACTGATDWFNQAYWGFAFIGVLAIVELILRSPDRLAALESLNLLSWLFTTCALIAMLFLARDVLVSPKFEGTGYGLINRFHAMHGYEISRETGLSRMAVVPAVTALVYLMSGNTWQRLLGGVALAGAFAVIWILQSRGATFAFAGAFLFVLLFGHRRGRGLAALTAIFLVASLIVLLLPTDKLFDLWMHATRDTGFDGFVSQSGRIYIWSDLFGHAIESPIFGYGPQADRLFGYNAQNAGLYALLAGGVLGATFFIIAILAAIRALAKLAAQAYTLPSRERRMFQITGGLLVFCILRSIPENNAALFSIDLLLQYPAMLYICELHTRIFDQSGSYRERDKSSAFQRRAYRSRYRS